MNDPDKYVRGCQFSDFDLAVFARMRQKDAAEEARRQNAFAIYIITFDQNALVWETAECSCRARGRPRKATPALIID